jgi:hypothetical protein
MLALAALTQGDTEHARACCGGFFVLFRRSKDHCRDAVNPIDRYAVLALAKLSGRSGNAPCICRLSRDRIRSAFRLSMYPAGIHVGDVLRARLRLTDLGDENLPDALKAAAAIHKRYFAENRQKHTQYTLRATQLALCQAHLKRSVPPAAARSPQSGPKAP